MERFIKREQQYWYIAIFVYVIFVMFFCAGSSVLINYMSTDSSVFFLMGRAMYHGKVVYKELFDHKGWYEYAINCVGAAISDSSSVGIWIVESIFMFINAWLVYKCCCRMKMARNNSFVMTVSFLGVALNYFTYYGGNLTENYALTFQLISFVVLIYYYTDNSDTHNPWYMLIHGWCVAVVFFLKTNIALGWLPIPFVILFSLLLKKQILNIVQNIVAGSVGLVLGFLPVVIYGICTNSLGDVWEQLILFNLKYSAGINGLEKIRRMVQSPIGMVFFIITILSCLSVMISKNIRCSAKVLFITSLISEWIAVGLSGRDTGHYFESLVIYVFPILFLIVSRMRIERLTIISTLIFMFTICLNLRFPIHVLGSSTSAKYVAEAETCASIKEELGNDDVSVLVTNNNALFYNKMQVIPDEKYFYTPSISYDKFPDAVDNQLNAIEKARHDIIVVCYNDYTKKSIYGGVVNEMNAVRSLQNYYTLIEKNEDLGIEMYVLNRDSE